MNLPDEFLPVPSADWKMLDWFNAAAVEKDIEVEQVASWLQITDGEAIWDFRRINNLKNGKEFIRERDLAKKFIMVLREIARRKHIQLFSNEYLDEHSRLFLLSPACAQKFAPLTDDELLEIIRRAPWDSLVISAPTLPAIRSRVQPVPPIRLFGRGTDLLRIKRSFDKHPVVLIDGIAGDGKTALAWHGAVQGWESGRFIAFDWTTDKRNIVAADGSLVPVNRHETPDDFLQNLLTSFCRQFGWLDILGAQNHVIINHCSDRLRKGRYLVVVDNLESVEESETVVRQLLDMLSPLGSDEPLSSRALITSRQQVHQQGVGLVSIAGIDEQARIPFIRSLEESWSAHHKLTDPHAAEIARLTDGNPLFMQIAVRRFLMMPQTIDAILADIEQGKHRAFDTLFAPLIQILTPCTLCLAVHLAYVLSISREMMGYDDLFGIWENLYPDHPQGNEGFSQALEELLNHRILSVSGAEGYTMHGLIRAFLINIPEGIIKQSCQQS